MVFSPFLIAFSSLQFCQTHLRILATNCNIWQSYSPSDTLISQPLIPPYGVPYTAIYSHEGVHAHPAVPLVSLPFIRIVVFYLQLFVFQLFLIQVTCKKELKGLKNITRVTEQKRSSNTHEHVLTWSKRGYFWNVSAEIRLYSLSLYKKNLMSLYEQILWHIIKYWS